MSESFVVGPNHHLRVIFQFLGYVSNICSVWERWPEWQPVFICNSSDVVGRSAYRASTWFEKQRSVGLVFVQQESSIALTAHQ
jgi:hypothetical protein